MTTIQAIPSFSSKAESGLELCQFCEHETNMHSSTCIVIQTVVQLLIGRHVQLLSHALPVSARALTAELASDRKSQRAKEKTVICFVKCIPIPNVVA